MINNTNKPEGIVERIISGLLLSISVLLTAIVIPFITGLILSGGVRGGGNPFVFVEFKLYTLIHPQSSLIMLLITFTLGYTFGSDKTLSTIGHMWLTEEPFNTFKSAAIWIFICFFYMASYKLWE